MERQMTVTGKGQAEVTPDVIGLNFNLETILPRYNDMLEESARSSHELLKIAMANGFEEKDLKTTSYTVNTRYHSYQNKNDKYQKEFIGYETRQSFQLEFPMDFKRLASILSKLSKSNINPEFTIYFTIADKEAVKDLVLVDATKKARKSAQVLADAAGVQLGSILQIDYSWNEVRLYSSTQYEIYDSSPIRMEAEAEPHIVPEDIKISDSVTFVWEVI